MFNQSIAQVTLSPTLRQLTFGEQFNQSLSDVRLPLSLVEFHLGSNFSHFDSLMSLSLPHRLNHLTIPNPVRPLNRQPARVTPPPPEYAAWVSAVQQRVAHVVLVD
jgi:hypothetical protein